MGGQAYIADYKNRKGDDNHTLATLKKLNGIF